MYFLICLSDQSIWSSAYLRVCVFCVLPTHTHEEDVTQGQFSSRVLKVLNHSFPSTRLVALTKAKEPNMPDYLPIAGGRIIRFVLF